MATATEKFSVELPIDVINSISELAREKKMSISKFISSLIKKESKTAEEKRWGKISIALKEEQEDAAASGFTEQDLSKLIKEIRQQQKNENCLVQRDSITLHRLKQYETKQQESSTKKG